MADVVSLAAFFLAALVVEMTAIFSWNLKRRFPNHAMEWDEIRERIRALERWYDAEYGRS